MKTNYGKKTLELALLTANGETQIICCESMKKQLEEILDGLTITVRAVEKKERRKIMSSGDFQFGLNNWGPDYADPMTYLGMWITNNSNNCLIIQK